MFSMETYKERRDRLKEKAGSGILLFLGNDGSPMNYLDNQYTFRQDSSFLYFWGLDLPELAAVIDIDRDRETIYGRDNTLEEIIWGASRTTMIERAESCGVSHGASPAQLETDLKEALGKGRPVHFLPPYRAEHRLKIHRLLGMDQDVVETHASRQFIDAVVAIRSIKSGEEIREIETALESTRRVQTQAMKLSRPGVPEKDVVAKLLEIAWSGKGNGMAFPIIFTMDGHIFHKTTCENVLIEGRLVVNDCGVESARHYSSDITRTFPVGGRFTDMQKAIYNVVLAGQSAAIEAIGPGVLYRDVHFIAARRLAEGLADLGIMKGDIETAVAEGAHTLFFPHGIGHMMGLDVHDMEALGEDNVGYTDTIFRSTGFGTDKLRLARELEPGFVVTVEPGLYFIPALIEAWRAEKKFEDFIDYSEVERYQGLGGVRIEDDVLVQEKGCRVLGPPIPKTIEEVEAHM